MSLNRLDWSVWSFRKKFKISLVNNQPLKIYLPVNSLEFHCQIFNLDLVTFWLPDCDIDILALDDLDESLEIL